MNSVRWVAPLVLAAAPVFADSLPPLVHFDAKDVDTSVNPCTDFYQYACGAYFKANPIPPDQVYWGKASPLQLWNETVLREVLEQAAAKKEGRTPREQKIGDYWAACMDEPGRERTGPAEMKAALAPVEALTDKAGLAGVVAGLHRRFPAAWFPDDNQTATPLLGLTSVQDFDDATRMILQIDQGGMSLPGRDFYLGDDERSKSLRGAWVEHVGRMLGLAGEPAEKARAQAQAVLAVETDLARAAMDNVSRRDPKNLHNVVTLAELKALTPSFDFTAYLAAVDAPKVDRYQVTSPAFFKALEASLQAHSLDDWKAYLRYATLHAAAPLLHAAVLEENWGFYGKTLTGAQQMQPRWRRCVRAADRDLGEALGEAYVARAFPPDSKQRVAEMVDAVEAALGRDVAQLGWMTPATKAKAREKLDQIFDKVGYPDRWRDYGPVAIAPGSYGANVAAATAFELSRWLHKVEHPVDRGEWIMTPPTINAYYDAQLNTINFPAGILQPPFFDAGQPDAVNYGAVGSVIGHEISHGFDDQGRKFDGRGNLRDWWTAEDARAYDERGQCIVDEYTQDLPDYGVKTNGKLTQGEDTADNGGIYLAMMALEASLKAKGKDLDTPAADGLTERQRFFLGYASNWCGQIRPEIGRMVVMTNPHSLPRFRVNNVVANMPEFARAFSCTKGQAMVRERACRVW